MVDSLRMYVPARRKTFRIESVVIVDIVDVVVSPDNGAKPSWDVAPLPLLLLMLLMMLMLPKRKRGHLVSISNVTQMAIMCTECTYNRMYVYEIVRTHTRDRRRSTKHTRSYAATNARQLADSDRS